MPMRRSKKLLLRGSSLVQNDIGKSCSFFIHLQSHKMGTTPNSPSPRNPDPGSKPVSNPVPNTGSNPVRKLVKLLSPSREHSVTSAALLLMSATMISRVVGYLRDAYIAWSFGAGGATDTYYAAFTLPDFLFYLAAGGSISITFVSILTRYIAEKREGEAQQAFSSVVTVMSVVFAVALVFGEIFARHFVTWWFSGFSPDQITLCTTLTRILMPQPLFFLVGGVVSAVQQTRRQFLIPAVAPIIYTSFIIGFGVLFSRKIGISSLAVGAVAGALVGPLLLNAWGAGRAGIRFEFNWDTRNPAFREWLYLSVPLMLGVSVVAADDWILRRFASGEVGEITRLSYAKRLLQVPIAVLGQAVGQASLPFFARLFSEGRLKEFAGRVNMAVSRLAAVSLLATAALLAMALPITDLAFRRGHFHIADSIATAEYVSVFALSLVFWAIQGLYARAFYAARDMMRPMVAGTIITALSVPVYWALFHRYGVVGLAFASNIAIFMHTAVLAVMLHFRRMVRFGGLEWAELGRAFATAVFAFFAARAVQHVFGDSAQRLHLALSLLLMCVSWTGAVVAGLWLTRSKLLGVLLRRS